MNFLHGLTAGDWRKERVKAATFRPIYSTGYEKHIESVCAITHTATRERRKLCTANLSFAKVFAKVLLKYPLKSLMKVILNLKTFE